MRATTIIVKVVTALIFVLSDIVLLFAMAAFLRGAFHRAIDAPNILIILILYLYVICTNFSIRNFLNISLPFASLCISRKTLVSCLLSVLSIVPLTTTGGIVNSSDL